MNIYVILTFLLAAQNALEYKIAKINTQVQFIRSDAIIMKYNISKFIYA